MTARDLRSRIVRFCVILLGAKGLWCELRLFFCLAMCPRRVTSERQMRTYLDADSKHVLSADIREASYNTTALNNVLTPSWIIIDGMLEC